MRFVSWCGVVYAFLLASSSYAQSELPLKRLRGALAPANSLAAGHRVLQFDEVPSQEIVAALQERGIRVLGDLPGNALLVSEDGSAGFLNLENLGVRVTAAFSANEKISPEVEAADFLLVEFHRDVDMGSARGLLLNMGLELRGNPDLMANHVLVRTPLRGRIGTLQRLAEQDEVAYIFPASEELVLASFVVPCPGALTRNGSVGQLVATFGDGWDGPGRNAATLNYVFGALTSKLPADTVRSEILRAMQEWSKVIALTWKPGSSSTGTRTMHVLFGAGSHGDSYPFDGPGKALAHTFYPAPPNPEPIAGDMHLDADETWRVGVNIDVYSVALHEIGHALGLGHSDNPNDVMYPYYRLSQTLSTGDKTAILGLYAAASSGAPSSPTIPSTPSPATPLSLTISAPATVTREANIALSGTARGPSALSVTWSSSGGAFGIASAAGSMWSIPEVPLATGVNTITITAASGLLQVQRTVEITRQSLQVNDTTAPLLDVLSPSTNNASTSLATLTVSGTASDNVGVTKITWQNNAGGSGVASGTSSWSAAVPILPGRNTIVIRAYDAAGNSRWKSLMVTR